MHGFLSDNELETQYILQLCTCQFQAPPPTPRCPHTPDRDLKLTLVPTPGAVDIEAEVFRSFVVVAFKGIESHLRLFDVTIAIYNSINIAISSRVARPFPRGPPSTSRVWNSS